MKITTDVVIIGGGLAGLTAAIHLSKLSCNVVVVEKNAYPNHKVCGEYISNEVLPYFEWLGLDISVLQPARLSNLEFSTSKGKTIDCKLPLGGFGISRYELDNYLFKKAIENGCHFTFDKVNDIHFSNDEFYTTTIGNCNFKSKIVLGAFGKRATIDYKLNRNFIYKKSPWLAIKAHYEGNFPNNLVGLYNFNGGYCGVSKVENNIINICYIVDYKSFKKYKNSAEFQAKVMYTNPNLKAILENSKIIFEKPLSISQISFQEKKAVENHILMIGDTAGLIHPLCGNGMAMAIHSAKIAAELVILFLKSETLNRENLEQKYIQNWNTNFKTRLATGRFLAKILQSEKVSNYLLELLVIFPSLLTKLIKNTHGKSIL